MNLVFKSLLLLFLLCDFVKFLELKAEIINQQIENKLKTVNINHILSIKNHNFELVTVPFVVCDTYKDETEDCEEYAQRQGSGIIITNKNAPKGWQDHIDLPFSFALINGKLHLNEYDNSDDINSEGGYPQLKDLFQVEDFNFDGHQDFCITEWHTPTRAGKPCSVYLFDAEKGYGFNYSPELTELTNSWMFDVINEDDEQYWQTLNKDGYHYDKSTRWHVINNIPEEYWIYTREADVEKDGIIGTLETKKELKDGEWQVIKEEFESDSD